MSIKKLAILSALTVAMASAEKAELERFNEYHGINRTTKRPPLSGKQKKARKASSNAKKARKNNRRK